MPIYGLDVSHHNSIRDWDSLSQVVGFVLVKASQYHTDVAAADHAARARQRGLAVGFYHYLVLAQDAARQAQLYVDSVDDLALSLPPIVDVESGGNSGVGVGETVAHLASFLDALSQVDSRRPIIYTSRADWSRMTGDDTTFSEVADLWLARYGDHPGRWPDGWGSWLFWQFTDRGRLPGCDSPLDLNLFDGEAVDLAQMSGDADVLIPEAAYTAGLGAVEAALFEVQPAIAAVGLDPPRVRLIGRNLQAVDSVHFGTVPGHDYAPYFDSSGTSAVVTVPAGITGRFMVTATSNGHPISSTAVFDAL